MTSANRVALNTTLQYIQLIVNVLVGLFSVRIILGALGKVDYGIYSLIGGIIVLLSFISTSLSQTSVRYISVALGSKKDSVVRITFQSCFSLHLLMATILLVILSLTSFFLFDGFLNIPDERITAAKVVFFCMLITLFLNVSTTPFASLIIAHERFDYYCGISIIDSLFKLLIAFIVAATMLDKLIIYGILMMFITIFNTCCYILCSFFLFRNQITFQLSKPSTFKDVSHFAGWTLFDTFGSIANRQGYAIMLNKFFGPVANTTFALAGQVEGHLYTMSSSVINTMKPQIMKSYGQGNLKRAMRLSMTAGKFGFSMMSLLAIPMIVLMPEILDLWLAEYPKDTVLFARLMVLACMGTQLTQGLVYANQAIGNIKWFSIIVSTIRMAALPLSIIVLFMGVEAYVAIIIFTICEFAGSLSRIFVMAKIANLNIWEFTRSVLLHIIPAFLITIIVCVYIHSITHGVWGLLFSVLGASLTFLIYMFFAGLTKEEDKSIHSILNTIKNKIF